VATGVPNADTLIFGTEKSDEEITAESLRTDLGLSEEDWKKFLENQKTTEERLVNWAEKERIKSNKKYDRAVAGFGK
jgi:hypothetical protein